jgi:hypothetical protein
LEKQTLVYHNFNNSLYLQHVDGATWQNFLQLLLIFGQDYRALERYEERNQNQTKVTAMFLDNASFSGNESIPIQS